MSGIDTRHLSRDSLFLMAEVIFEGETDGKKVKIRNLSSGGLMAEGASPVARGTKVKTNLRNIGWVDGVVAWIQDDRFGIAFASDVDPKMARIPGINSHFETPRFVRPSSLIPYSSMHDSDKMRKV